MADQIAKRRERIISAVQDVVRESGNPVGFDAASWLDEWLSHPLSALGGRLPSDYLETDDGCDLLIQLIRRAQTGAFS